MASPSSPIIALSSKMSNRWYFRGILFRCGFSSTSPRATPVRTYGPAPPEKVIVCDNCDEWITLIAADKDGRPPRPALPALPTTIPASSLLLSSMHPRYPRDGKIAKAQTRKIHALDRASGLWCSWPLLARPLLHIHVPERTRASGNTAKAIAT